MEPHIVPAPPASSAGPSACATAFSIVELLEHILSLLPARDLLLSQRVCTLWRDVIRSSSDLQRALFFLPDALPNRTRKRSASSSPRPNRLLSRAFPCGYPSLLPSAPLRPEIHGLALDFPARGQQVSNRDAVLYEQASWRRMLFCQPPCKGLKLVKAAPWRVSEGKVIEAPEGITMGFFHEKAGRAEGWDPDMVGGDGAWHFEGIVVCY